MFACASTWFSSLSPLVSVSLSFSFVVRWFFLCFFLFVIWLSVQQHSLTETIHLHTICCFLGCSFRNQFGDWETKIKGNKQIWAQIQRKFGIRNNADCKYYHNNDVDADDDEENPNRLNEIICLDIIPSSLQFFHFNFLFFCVLSFHFHVCGSFFSLNSLSFSLYFFTIL